MPAHWERTRRRVFVEYVMLAGVNDSPAQARLLAATLGREPFKVNLIPYNPTGMYDGSPAQAIARSRRSSTGGVPATVRLTRGRDIAAACRRLHVASATAAAVRSRRCEMRHDNREQTRWSPCGGLQASKSATRQRARRSPSAHSFRRRSMVVAWVSIGSSRWPRGQSFSNELNGAHCA